MEAEIRTIYDRYLYLLAECECERNKLRKLYMVDNPHNTGYVDNIDLWLWVERKIPH